jgi:hypothetical protein
MKPTLQEQVSYLDKWESKKFNYGSKLVNIVADKTQVGSLGAVGYDDEGVVVVSGILLKMVFSLTIKPFAIRRIFLD